MPPPLPSSRQTQYCPPQATVQHDMEWTASSGILPQVPQHGGPLPGPPLLPPLPPGRHRQCRPPQAALQQGLQHDMEWLAISGMSSQVLELGSPPVGPLLNMGPTRQSWCPSPQTEAASKWGQGQAGGLQAAEQARHGAIPAPGPGADMQPPLPPTPPPPPPTPPPPPPLGQPCCRLPSTALSGNRHIAPDGRGASDGMLAASWGVPQSAQGLCHLPHPAGQALQVKHTRFRDGHHRLLN